MDHSIDEFEATPEDFFIENTVIYHSKESYASDENSQALETYMRQLSKFPILSKTQEIEVATKLKKNREILYLAFLESPSCKKQLLTLFEHDVGKIRRMFDRRAISVNDDTEVSKLKERIREALVSGNFTATDRNLFKGLVIPFNEFYTLVNMLTASPMSNNTIKALNNFNECKKTLSECNLRLVFARAKRFMNRGFALEDLIQEGNVGLLKAIEKYDPTKGFKFGTFATWWIDQAFGRALADKSRLVRIPVHMLDSMNKVNKAFQKLSESLGREPTSEELASYTGITLDRVEKVRDTIIIKSKSLEDFQYPNNNYEKPIMKLGELPDNAKGADELIEEQETYQQVRDFLATLPPQDEKVLRLRFGIGEKKMYDLREIANVLKISKQRVSKIENRAIQKLRS